MMKKILLLVLLVLGFGLLSACSSDDNINDTNEDNEETELLTFTLEELADYDGRDGRDAYIAVDGFVYDVSDSNMWPNGLHRNEHQAGQDLSDVINSSPHGRSVLDGIPKIGELVEAS